MELLDSYVLQWPQGSHLRTVGFRNFFFLHPACGGSSGGKAPGE